MGTLFVCEKFDTRNKVEDIPVFGRSTSGGVAELVGPLGDPARALRFSFGTQDVDLRMKHDLNTPLATYEAALHVRIAKVTTIDIAAIELERPAGGGYAVYVTIRNKVLKLLVYPEGQAVQEKDVGPVADGMDADLGLYVSLAANKASLFVNGTQRAELTAINAPTTSRVFFTYGPFSEIAHEGSVVTYDDVRLVGKP